MRDWQIIRNSGDFEGAGQLPDHVFLQCRANLRSVRFSSQNAQATSSGSSSRANSAGIRRHRVLHSAECI